VVLLGATRALAFDPVVVGSWPEPGPYHLSAYQVERAGERIYLCDDVGVRIIDISKPRQPQAIGTYIAGRFKERWYDASDAGQYSVALQGSKAFVSYTEQVYVTRFETAWGSGIDAVDVTDPGTPIATAHLFAESVLAAAPLARRIAVAGTNLYAAHDRDGQLQVYGVSDPARIRPIGVPIASTIGYPTDVVGVGRFAYLVGDGGLEVIDSEHYGGPAVVGRLNLYSNPIAVAVAGQYAYVILPAITPTPTNGALAIIDVSRTTAPKLLGTYQTAQRPNRAAVRAGYAYVGGYDGLEVIDVHDPKKPKHVTTLDLGLVNDIAIGGCYAYVAAGTNGLQVVQIDDQPSLSIGPSATGASLQLDGVFGQSYVIESCAGLPPATGWTSVTNVSLTNATQLMLDTLATTDKARFYRARQSQ